jgi:hypothetical protein
VTFLYSISPAFYEQLFFESAAQILALYFFKGAEKLLYCTKIIFAAFLDLKFELFYAAEKLLLKFWSN